MNSGTRVHAIKMIALLVLLCFSSSLSPELPSGSQEVTGLKVPDGFTIERVVDPGLLSYPMFASFDETGRLFVFESTGTNDMGTEQMLKNPTYHIRLLEDSDGDGIFEKSTIFADSIPLPMGGSYYKGSLYVAESPDLVKYTDTDHDGKADSREVILSGWVLHANAATLSGPFIGPDGWLYMPDARRGFDITTKEGAQLKGKGARIWRCRPDGSELESMSGGGFDNAIEIAFMPTGETIGTMTYFMDPQGGYRDGLMHWVEGGVYPKPHGVIHEDKLTMTGPLMPVMTKTARVAPSGLMRMKGERWGNEYAGNLFSAEFNTGRIMRHVVSADGASYSTVDSPFMTSTVADSHPTDVLQDADGSMLVVITGGWFIEGCPLSRVAKPDVPGGIYRIRKKGSAVSDAWGKKENWSDLSLPDLTRLLGDSRPAVRERATGLLVEAGNQAIPVLKKDIETTIDRERQVEGVFAISRIGTPEAAGAVRGLLSSRHPEVRTAAARISGLNRDALARPVLEKIVGKDLPQVIRQAATALGQIGDSRSIPALLKAVDSSDDRFVEHAVIYSLIGFGVQTPLIKALAGKSVNSRKAALIALDQIENSELKKEHLAPFLDSNEEVLRNAGIWVATHRPEWTDMVVQFLDKQLGREGLAEEELIAYRNLMVTFCKNEALQEFAGRQLENDAVSPERKLLYLSVIGNCDVATLPATWSRQLAALLGPGSAEVKSEVLNIIQSRRVKGADKELADMINDESLAAGVRMKALAAGLGSGSKVPEKQFSLIASFLGKDYDAPVRQAAANLLVQVSMSDRQLVDLASKHLANADQFLLPALVEVFAGGKSEQAGMAFIGALNSSSDRLNNISEPDLLRVLSSYPGSVQNASSEIIQKLRSQNAERLEKLASLEKELPEGDVLEGRKLFFGKGACSACHAVGSDGGDFGPDLTNIGDIRSRSDILEAILYPSVSFAREHETVNVTTGSGVYMGIIKEQAADYLVIVPGPGAGIRINRSEIKSIEPHNVSMMPPGLDELLSLQEMADLMAFMEALPDGIRPAATAR